MKFRLVDRYLTEPVLYGGLPSTRAEIIRDLEAQGCTRIGIDRYLQGLDAGTRQGENMTTQATQTTRIILIRDGMTLWGADEAELLSALDAHGWEIHRHGADHAEVIEPPREEHVDRYADLCGDVAEVAGYGAYDKIDTEDRRVVGEMAYSEMATADRRDGRHVWTLRTIRR